VHRLHQALAEHGYVPLADAAQRLNLPLTTLTTAVRRKRVLAIEVLPRRWYVSLSDVQRQYAEYETAGANDATLDAALEGDGIVSCPTASLREERASWTPPALPSSSGKTYAEMVVEARR
jgi:hypothetical protein